MKHIKLFEQYINESKRSKLRGWTSEYYQLSQKVFDLSHYLEDSKSEIAFLNSLECAKEPTETFTQDLEHLSKNAIPHQTKQIKKRMKKIKKLQAEFNSDVKKEPGAAEAMKIATKLSNARTGMPSLHDMKLTAWERDYNLTDSDYKKCEKFIADYTSKYEPAKKAGDKMKETFYDYLENKIK